MSLALVYLVTDCIMLREYLFEWDVRCDHFQRLKPFHSLLHIHTICLQKTLNATGLVCNAFILLFHGHSRQSGKSWPNGLRVGLVIQRLWVRISGPAGIVGGGVNNQRSSPPSIPRLRCPWARHRTPNCSLGAVTWLPTAPGVCSLRMG